MFFLLFRKNSKKARELWWHGIPTNVRGKVWKLALGNDLNITPGRLGLYIMTWTVNMAT